jgi:hypothetical protein
MLIAFDRRLVKGGRLSLFTKEKINALELLVSPDEPKVKGETKKVEN